METCEACFLKFEVHHGVIAAGVSDYPVMAKARYCPACGAPMMNQDDPLYCEAIAIAEEKGECSVSFLQRKMRIGYTRAARLMEHMEVDGLLGEQVDGRIGQWRVVMKKSNQLLRSVVWIKKHYRQRQRQARQ